MRTPQYAMSIFKERRKKLANHLKDSALILTANPEVIRNGDVHYPFRQNSNMFYLTGFEEPNSALIFRPGKNPETVLFVMSKDPAQETWTGFRYGVEGAKRYFEVDEVYSIDSVQDELPKLLSDVDQIYYSLFSNTNFDTILMDIINDLTWSRSRSNRGNLPIIDPCAMLGEMRLRKSNVEVEWHRRACEISAEAHIEVMKTIRPGINERALHGVFLRSIMERGCAREGYGAIVAGGENATTLHYEFNDQVCKDGDLLLLDAGAEYNYFSGDITRVFPVNGRFSDTQKRIYQKMLNVQKDLVSLVKPGTSREALQTETVSRLTELMIDEKLLKGRKDDLIEKKEYERFYMHRVSHWLGMEVHDAGTTLVNGEPRVIEPGFVLTIEPGLYISKDAPGVPDELRGIGIRIEDDVLVTESGHEVLSSKCPKEIADIEAVMRH